MFWIFSLGDSLWAQRHADSFIVINRLIIPFFIIHYIQSAERLSPAISTATRRTPTYWLLRIYRVGRRSFRNSACLGTVACQMASLLADITSLQINQSCSAWISTSNSSTASPIGDIYMSTNSNSTSREIFTASSSSLALSPLAVCLISSRTFF